MCKCYSVLFSFANVTKTCGRRNDLNMALVNLLYYVVCLKLIGFTHNRNKIFSVFLLVTVAMPIDFAHYNNIIGRVQLSSLWLNRDMCSRDSGPDMHSCELV